MRKLTLTALIFAAFTSTASAQNEIVVLDGRMIMVPSSAQFDHYMVMCDKHINRVDHKKECKVDMEVQKKLWDSFVQARKHASLGAVAKLPDHEQYGLERARAILKQLDANRKTIEAAWPEILRSH